MPEGGELGSLHPWILYYTITSAAVSFRAPRPFGYSCFITSHFYHLPVFSFASSLPSPHLLSTSLSPLFLAKSSSSLPIWLTFSPPSIPHNLLHCLAPSLPLPPACPSYLRQPSDRAEPIWSVIQTGGQLLLHGAHGVDRKMVCCRCLGAPLNLPGLELSLHVCVSFPACPCCQDL